MLNDDGHWTLEVLMYYERLMRNLHILVINVSRILTLDEEIRIIMVKLNHLFIFAWKILEHAKITELYPEDEQSQYLSYYKKYINPYQFTHQTEQVLHAHLLDQFDLFDDQYRTSTLSEIVHAMEAALLANVVVVAPLPPSDENENENENSTPLSRM